MQNHCPIFRTLPPVYTSRSPVLMMSECVHVDVIILPAPGYCFGSCWIVVVADQLMAMAQCILASVGWRVGKEE